MVEFQAVDELLTILPTIMLSMVEDLQRPKYVQRVKVIMDSKEDLNGLRGSIISDCTHLDGICR